MHGVIAQLFLGPKILHEECFSAIGIFFSPLMAKKIDQSMIELDLVENTSAIYMDSTPNMSFHIQLW